MTKVLIAAASAEYLSLLRNAFENENYEVFDAKDGSEAIMLAKQRSPELVVTDAALAVMNGFEVVARLKEDPQTQKIPCIVISPIYISAKDIERGFIRLSKKYELSADTYIIKPVSRLELVQKTRRLLSNNLAPESTPIKALIVDDNQSDIRLIKAALKHKNLEASYTVTGDDARERIKAERPDFTLLDLRLPQMSGLEILEFLKSELPMSAVVVMTAYSSEEAILESLRLGVDGILLKPVNSHELKLAINNALEKVRLRMENEELEKQLRNASRYIMDSYEEAHDLHKSTVTPEVLHTAKSL